MKSNDLALAKREKPRNRGLVRKRNAIEQVFRALKVFRILGQQYRKRRKRFALRFNVMAAMDNLELT